MLILSRKRDEEILIGDDVRLTVVDIRGDKVRLGINAPGNVPVHRREVYEAIQRGEGPKHSPQATPAAKPPDERLREAATRAFELLGRIRDGVHDPKSAGIFDTILELRDALRAKAA